MNKKILLFLLLFAPIMLFGQKAVFLHHSTGENVYNAGVPAQIATLNSANGTSVSIAEFDYPSGTYDWKNYPYDFWYLWIGGGCGTAYPNLRECLSYYTSQYDLIIYKHCYPGAGIQADSGTPSVSSETKTIGNYKLQYRALRALMDSYPNNKFMVWTLAPLHRLATNSTQAARAREFVNWVKNEWLFEDGKPHPNIYIFDFYGLAASSIESEGQINCLKYNYEKDHNGDDSHPNSLANTTIAPIFAKAIYDALLGTK